MRRLGRHIGNLIRLPCLREPADSDPCIGTERTLAAKIFDIGRRGAAGRRTNAKEFAIVEPKIAELAPQMRTAFSSIAANTGCKSPGDELMTRSTSEIAARCSRASSISRAWRSSRSCKSATEEVVRRAAFEVVLRFGFSFLRCRVVGGFRLAVRGRLTEPSSWVHDLILPHRGSGVRHSERLSHVRDGSIFDRFNQFCLPAHFRFTSDRGLEPGAQPTPKAGCGR
jgi:hypothetical protein